MKGLFAMIKLSKMQNEYSKQNINRLLLSLKIKRFMDFIHHFYMPVFPLLALHKTINTPIQRPIKSNWLGMLLGSGTKSWFCDQYLGDFKNQPDRSQCTDVWINESEKQIDNRKPPREVATFIATSLKEEKNPVESNSILKLADQFEQLIEEQIANENKYKDTKEFAEQMMEATNAVFGEYNGWQEISDVSIKNEKVSRNKAK